MSACRVASMLRTRRFNLTNEQVCQAEIAEFLRASEVEFEREVWLSATDRIDFLCENGVGIEVKLRGSRFAWLRQLKRYEASTRIQELILVASRHMPTDEIGLAKPLSIVHLNASWL